MAQSFKALIVTAEGQSDEFTQFIAVIDGVAWELDSTLSGINKDAAGYRLQNAANVTGGPNYIKGELETASGRAAELLAALQPVAALAARWNAEDFAKASNGAGVYEATQATGDPGKAGRYEIDARA